MNPTARRNLRPLPSRVAVLHAVRLTVAAVVLGLAFTEASTLELTGGTVAPTIAVYLLVTTTVAMIGHLRPGVGPRAMSLLLLVDGACLASLLAASGGTRSVLLFLVFAHLVAVTLLISYRTGLKVAMWHSLLLIVVHYAQVDQGGPSAKRAALVVAGFWTVAVLTAVCSSINERELRRSREQLDALTSMVTALDQVQRPDDVVAVLLGAATDAFGFRRAAAALADDGHARLRILDADGDLHEATYEDPTVQAPVGTHRSPRLCVTLDPATDPALAAALPGATNVVVLPLVVDGAVVGHVGLERGGARAARIAASTVAMLGQFAAHAALAFGNTRLLAEVRRLASIDVLTGLANRRAFETALDREISRSLRTGEPLSLMLTDIDHFKAVNDAHGHQVGDDVLAHVGAMLLGHARPMDLPARYGGEEFAVVLPACAPADAEAVAERLRKVIEPGAPVPVTASAGVATLSAGMGAHELIRAADQALYSAKAAGRNQTRVAGSALSVA